ncbi:hypothetical protein KQQSB11_460089 [Klebsiella quasipneumoniae subsp. quasipneumoniae]|nr:hypothetical protein KQQSB11_460089 [Klebsiella quasipneumoniae subsp. quasipneumoniae]
MSGAGGGELFDFAAAGLRLVSAVGETVAAKKARLALCEAGLQRVISHPGRVSPPGKAD